MKKAFIIPNAFTVIAVIVLLSGTSSAQIFNAPRISITAWNGDTSGSVQISIIDSSDCEIGYLIYRDQNFSSSFSQIFDTVSTNPVTLGDTIVWRDNTISFNTWYRYKVAVYKSDDSLFSAPCTTFTLHYIPPQPRQVVRFTKLSDYSIATDTTCWSGQNGNYIVLKETTAPAGQYTRIDVSNPANPVSAGYIDSATAVSYPQQTLIPAFLKFGVSNNYAKTQIVRCVVNHTDRVVIAKDSIVRMYMIAGNNLASIGSPLTISLGLQPASIQLVFLNDTLLGILLNHVAIFTYKVVSLSSAGFSSPLISFSQAIGITDICMPRCSMGYFDSWRPYFHGVSGQTMYISYDNDNAFYNITWTDTFSTYCDVYNLANNTKDSITANMPFANAYNTGYYLPPIKNLCTNGFSLSGNLKPGNIATELFFSDIGDLHPYQTAATYNAIYRDSVHNQYKIQNIILDTLTKRVYLIFNDTMSILSYQSQTVGVSRHAENLTTTKGLFFFSNAFSSSVTIVLPTHSASTPADLYFYDLSGRVIDRMLGVTSNAVLWRPKTRLLGCYIVMARIGGEKHTAKFMVR